MLSPQQTPLQLDSHPSLSIKPSLPLSFPVVTTQQLNMERLTISLPLPPLRAPSLPLHYILPQQPRHLARVLDSRLELWTRGGAGAAGLEGGAGLGEGAR